MGLTKVLVFWRAREGRGVQAAQKVIAQARGLGTQSISELVVRRRVVEADRSERFEARPEVGVIGQAAAFGGSD